MLKQTDNKFLFICLRRLHTGAKKAARDRYIGFISLSYSFLNSSRLMVMPIISASG